MERNMFLLKQLNNFLIIFETTKFILVQITSSYIIFSNKDTDFVGTSISIAHST